MSEAATGRLVTETFCRRHPAAAARALERMPPEEIDAVVARLAPELAAPVVAALDRAAAGRWLTAGPALTVSAVVAALEPAEAAALLRGVPAEDRGRLMAALPTDAANRIETALRYPVETAGALLDPSAFTAVPDATVGETLERLRATAGRLRSYVFVVARDGRLSGVADLSTMIAAPPERTMAAVARPDAARLRAGAGRAEILAHPSWSDLRALPVVDETGRFLGVLRYRALRALTGDSAVSLDVGAVRLGLELGELCCAVLLDTLSEVADAAGRVGGTVGVTE